MMKLLQSLPLALLATLAVVPFTSGTVEETQPTSAQVASVESSQENLCGRCGDGYCSKTCGETAAGCPKDCGVAY